MVSKSVFVEVCLRMSRNILSQIGIKGRGKKEYIGRLP